MARFQILALLCVVTFCSTVCGIVNIDPEKKEQIDSFVNSVLFDCEKHDVVGMNLAIVHEGEILYTTGYGARNLDTNEPVTENTIYAIASVSKHFTTTLLGQTLENNGYNWDTKVHDILADVGTEFYFYDPLRSNLTTLRDLGSHSAGIARNDYLWILQNMTRSEQVSRLRFIEGIDEPRTTFVYNNLMFMLQGHVTELLGGASWEDLVQSEIYDKIGMVNSSLVYYLDEDSAEIATPYLPYLGGLREIPWSSYRDMGVDLGPPGGIATTANDMARWMNVLLSGGQNEAGEEVFSPEVIAETQAPVNAYSNGGGYYPPEYPVSYRIWSSYGLGLGQGEYRGYRSIAHGGALWGEYTQLQLYPDINLGVYTSLNGLEGLPSAMESIHLFVADVILEEEPWLNASWACDRPFSSKNQRHFEHKDIDVTLTGDPVEPDTASKKPHHLKQVDQYLGQYGNFAYGNVTVTVEDVLEELILNFDVYSCTVLNISGRAVCEGRDDFWYLTVRRIDFDEENSPSQFVDMTFTAVEGPVRFERDLLFEDAPGPRDHWPACDEVFPPSKVKKIV